MRFRRPPQQLLDGDSDRGGCGSGCAARLDGGQCRLEDGGGSSREPTFHISGRSTTSSASCTGHSSVLIACRTPNTGAIRNDIILWELGWQASNCRYPG